MRRGAMAKTPSRDARGTREESLTSERAPASDTTNHLGAGQPARRDARCWFWLVGRDTRVCGWSRDNESAPFNARD